MSNERDYNQDRECPVYKRVIDCDLCYESGMALSRMIKVSTVPELSDVEDIEQARKTCVECPYHNQD